MVKNMEMTCILCPIGCRLTAEERDEKVIVEGNTCKRGAKYGEQEMLNPMRMVTSSVRITGGARPLCPVKTAAQIPKSKIPEVLCEIRTARVLAPIHIGQVLIPNVAGTGVDIVATANR